MRKLRTKTIDSLFDELFIDESNDLKKKNGFVRKLININFWSILLSIIVYLFQFAPVLVTPLLTTRIINIVTHTLIVGAPVDWNFWKTLIIYTIIIILVLLENVPATRLRYWIVSRLIRNTNAGIKCSVIRKLQSLSITYSKDMESGKIQSKFLRDIDNFEVFLSHLLNNFVPNVVSAIAAVVTAVVSNGIVSLFFLIVVPANILLSLCFREKIKKQSKDFRVSNENMGAKLSTMIEMIPVTKAHGLEKVEFSSVSKEIEKVKTSGVTLDRTIGHFGSLNWAVNMILSALCIVFCSILAINKKIEVGDILLYQSLFSTISSYISAIVSIYPELAKGLESANSLSELMSVRDVEFNLNSGFKTDVEGNIEFKDVSYAYPNTALPTIKNLNLSVKKGECIAVVGSSGSGKSTLMNMIIGLLKPTSGELLIDGKSITELDLSAYRHSISVVPQNSVLFAGSIIENITYGLDNYSEEDLQKAIDNANVNEFASVLENGLETNVGERGEKLSGGQRQRVTIARALIRNPKILIFDEATSSLDNVSEYHVQKAISLSTEGKTTFIVAHRLSTIRNADRILFFEDGKIVEQGNYDELMKLKGKFYNLKKLNDLNSKEVESELFLK